MKYGYLLLLKMKTKVLKLKTHVCLKEQSKDGKCLLKEKY